MSNSQKRLRQPVTGHVKPEKRQEFVALTSDNGMSVSEGIARLVDWAIKKKRIPK